MAKILSFLEENRSPDDILIDAGDMIQGSYSAGATKGAIAVTTFNLMNYNIFVPGNHEFDFGSTVLRENMQNIKAEILCTNWNFTIPLKNIRPYTIIERNNIRIGFIGIGERESRHRIMADKSLSFTPEEHSIAAAAAALRKEKVDIIIMIRHGGIYFSGGSLYSLLKNFPETDIVIGGHSHQVERGKKIAGAYYVQPGAYAEGISKIKIDFDDNKRKINRISSEYFEVGHYPPSPELKNIIAEEKAVKYKGYQKKANILPTSIKNISEAQKYLTLQALDKYGKADADIFFSTPTAIPYQNFLSKYLIFSMFPYDENVVTIPLDIKEYQTILNECKKYSQKYKIPVFIKHYNGNKKYITLRTSSFVLSGGGRNFPFARSIAEKKQEQIKIYPSLRQSVFDIFDQAE